MLNKENVKMSNSIQKVKSLEEESKMLNKVYENLNENEIQFIEDYCVSENLSYNIDVIDETVSDVTIIFQNENQVNELESLMKESVVKESVEYESDNDLEHLMKVYNIPTFVSLARVVNCTPQQLYARKNHKTGEYRYDSIARYLIKQYKQNINEIENVTIEDIVKLASEYLYNKEKAKTNRQQKDNVQKAIKQYEKLQKILETLTEDELTIFNKTINFKELVK